MIGINFYNTQFEETRGTIQNAFRNSEEVHFAQIKNLLRLWKKSSKEKSVSLHITLLQFYIFSYLCVGVLNSDTFDINN